MVMVNMSVFKEGSLMRQFMAVDFLVMALEVRVVSLAETLSAHQSV